MNELPTFVSFASGSYAWRATGQRLLNQAEGSKYFSACHLLGADDGDRSRAYGQLDRDARGFGHWRWKPQVVHQKLSALPKAVPGIWYVDAGCSIFSNEAARQRMKEYIDFGLENGTGTFFQLSSNFSDLKYTKPLAHAAVAIPDIDKATGQVQATAFFIANSTLGKDLCEEWAELSRNEALFDDSREKSFEDSVAEIFVDHRHDQSLLSLLVKRGQVPLLVDELNIERRDLLNEIEKNGPTVPIVATRHRSGFSSLSMSWAWRGVRAVERLFP